jgi:hypothetical protein
MGLVELTDNWDVLEVGGHDSGYYSFVLSLCLSCRRYELTENEATKIPIAFIAFWIPNSPRLEVLLVLDDVAQLEALLVGFVNLFSMISYFHIISFNGYLFILFFEKLDIFPSNYLVIYNFFF